jgi:hypothetical protein
VILDLREEPFSFRDSHGTWLVIGGLHGHGSVTLSGSNLKPDREKPRTRRVKGLIELWFDLEALLHGFKVEIESEVLPTPGAYMTERRTMTLWHDRKADEFILADGGVEFAFPADEFNGVRLEHERTTGWERLLTDNLIANPHAPNTTTSSSPRSARLASRRPRG